MFPNILFWEGDLNIFLTTTSNFLTKELYIVSLLKCLIYSFILVPSIQVIHIFRDYTLLKLL